MSYSKERSGTQRESLNKAPSYFLNDALSKGGNMKEFVVAKMVFIFLYLILVLIYIASEMCEPCWVSYIRGIGTACFTLSLIKSISDIVHKKDDNT